MPPNVREILDCVKYFLSPRPCLDSPDPHGRRPDPTPQKDHHARCLAGGAGAHLRAPRPPGGGTRADARQPARRPGPALVLQVGDRPGDQPAPPELLLPLALAAGGATLVQAITGFGLSQILGVAAQRAITDMRRTVQAYVLRLPISYFDSTKSGILISRIMTDAEGIRNLVGTGLVQLVGGLITAAIALGVLFYLNWRLTLIAILILACFGGGMAYAFTKLRPLFRDRSKLNAEVTGRLGETLGGIRIVQAYRAERSERLVVTPRGEPPVPHICP